MVRHSDFVLRLQILIPEDWTISFTVFYLAATTEATFNGAAGQNNLMGYILASSEICRDEIPNDCCRCK